MHNSKPTAGDNFFAGKGTVLLNTVVKQPLTIFYQLGLISASENVPAWSFWRGESFPLGKRQALVDTLLMLIVIKANKVVPCWWMMWTIAFHFKCEWKRKIPKLIYFWWWWYSGDDTALFSGVAHLFTFITDAANVHGWFDKAFKYDLTRVAM